MNRKEIHSKEDRAIPLSKFNKPGTMTPEENEEAFAADYTRECEVCGDKPVVNATGLCGPLHLGRGGYRRR